MSMLDSQCKFSTSSLNVHSVHGPVINPHQVPHSSSSWADRERRSAGGSSGGSAAAVAAGLCDTYEILDSLFYMRTDAFSRKVH